MEPPRTYCGISIIFQLAGAYMLPKDKILGEISMDLKSGNLGESKAMNINPQNAKTRARNAPNGRRNSDVFDNLYNNAPAPDVSQGDQPSGVKVVNELISDFVKGPARQRTQLYGARDEKETEIDLVKLVTAGFKYLAELNPKLSDMKMPKRIEFRSADDSSLLYDINTHQLIEDLNGMMNSITIKQYVDKIARKAAVLYRALTISE